MFKNIILLFSIIIIFALSACVNNNSYNPKYNNQYFFSAGKITGDATKQFKKSLANNRHNERQISGNLSLNYHITKDFENVFAKEIGQTEETIIIDEFTKEKWLSKKPQIYYKEKLCVTYKVVGSITFNWQLNKNKEIIKTGITEVKIEKIFAGYLGKNKNEFAEKKLEEYNKKEQNEIAEIFLVEALISKLQGEIGSNISFNQFELGADYNYIKVNNHNDLEEIKRRSEEILYSNPSYIHANFNLGLYYEFHKDYEKALNYYKKAGRTAFPLNNTRQKTKYYEAINRITILLTKQNKLPKAVI